MTRSILLPLLAVFAIGCDDEGFTSTDTGDKDNGCTVAGMRPALEAGMTISALSYNGQSMIGAFNKEGVYDGIPAACVSATGKSAVFQFEANDARWGELFIEAQEVGGYSLDDTSVSVRLSVLGPPAETFTSGPDWQTGTWYIESFSPLSLDLQGSAISGSNLLSIRLSAEAQ